MADQGRHYIEIEKKLDIIENHINKNLWEEVPKIFFEIRDIKKKIDKNLADSNTNPSEVLNDQKNKVLSKIETLEKKIKDWMNKQKSKIETLKKNESHLNGYKKQSNRSYYVDKSE